jgi:hypothetical protein
VTDYTLLVLSRTLEILIERGWHQDFPASKKGPLNIRSALSEASFATIPANWHKAFVESSAVLNQELGGISHWEFGVQTKKGHRPRNHDEVVATLAEIIRKVQTHEIQLGPESNPYGRPSGKHGPGDSTV